MSEETQRRRPANAADGSAPPDRNQDTMPDEHLDAELLAAWLDSPDDFASDERRRIAAHLNGCAACRQVLVELQALVTALQALPEIEPRRSFALTPALAGLSEEHGEAREPIVLQESRPWLERQLRTLRWAAAVAAVLFVIVVSADLLSGNGGSSTTSADLAASAPHTEAVGGVTAKSSDYAATEATGEGRSSAEMTPTALPMAAVGAAPQQATVASDASGAMAATETTSGAAGGAAADTASEATGETTTAAIAATEASPAADNSTTSQAVVAESTETAPPATVQPAPQPAASGHGRLRILEVGLALALAWLLAAMALLPRLPDRR